MPGSCGNFLTRASSLSYWVSHQASFTCAWLHVHSHIWSTASQWSWTLITLSYKVLHAFVLHTGWCTTKKNVSRNRPWALLRCPSSTARSLWPMLSAPAPGELQSSSPRGQTQTWPSAVHHRCSHLSPWHRRGRWCRTCSIKISEDGETLNVYSQSKPFSSH